ncbi:catabolite control protein A [Abditibacteriota bacterium]|nr:catabolite control protein A [Abditibacteriota bacterium]
MNPLEKSRRSRNDGAVTLQHVADLAGVHPMTVSNALKGTGRVSDLTREKIQRIARELDYKPNLAARALVTGRTGSVAVATGPVSEHFYAHLLSLLENELKTSDYKMLFLRSRDLGRDLLSTLRNNAVDGIIAIDAFPDLRDYTRASSRVPPCVYAGVFDPDDVIALPVDHIKIDLSRAVREAVGTLISNCSQVAYVVSNDIMSEYREVRANVYIEMMEAAGRTPNVIKLGIGGDTSRRDLTRANMVEYLKTHPLPDGMLCQNDEMAMGVYRALRDLGLRIPDDVQLVGCDGLKDMKYFDPALASIVQPSEEMCALAWQFLQRRLTHPETPVQEATLYSRFEARESVKI